MRQSEVLAFMEFIFWGWKVDRQKDEYIINKISGNKYYDILLVKY